MLNQGSTLPKGGPAGMRDQPSSTIPPSGISSSKIKIRQRAKRSVRICEECRRRHTRCEGVPCSRCKQFGRKCRPASPGDERCESPIEFLFRFLGITKASRPSKVVHNSVGLCLSEEHFDVSLDKFEKLIPAVTLEKIDKASVGCQKTVEIACPYTVRYMGLRIRKQHADHFVEKLFRSKVEWIKRQLCIAVPSASILVVPQRHVYFYGATEEAVRELFGLEVHAAVINAGLLTNDTPNPIFAELVLAAKDSIQGTMYHRIQVYGPAQDLTNCVWMAFEGSDIVIHFTLGLWPGIPIAEILQKQLSL